MEMITPQYLQHGDVVGIVAPAQHIEKEDIENAVKIIEEWGLNVELGEHLFDEYHQFAGTDRDRASDLQLMFENPRIKAIICARGGYGSIRTLEYLDYRVIQQNPKWLVGYSDISVFHALFNCHLGIETIHGIMPINFPLDEEDNISTDILHQALIGKLKEYNLPHHKWNSPGKATGKIIGGNLSILQSIAATPTDIITDDAILFIEDVGEYLYTIDRMMMNLKTSGKLSKLKAVIVGAMTDIKDGNTPFGKNANELVNIYVSQLGVPASFNFPAGHQEVNLAMYFGRTVTLDINDTGVNLQFNP